MSLALPEMAAGTLSAILMLAGTMQPVIRTLSGIVSGVSRGILRGILVLTPDLYGAAAQAGKFLLGEKVEVHSILGGLLFLYAGAVLVLVIHRKEA